MQKAIIIGATSGIGQEVARILVQQGWHIGIAGRRKEALHALQATAPDRIVTEQLDVTEEIPLYGSPAKTMSLLRYPY